jgi:hypothetical protein
MKEFQKLDCKLKWRQFDDDLAYDLDVYFNSSLSMYVARQEYDLRFFCLMNACKLKYLLTKFAFYFLLLSANAVDEISVAWNTNPQLNSFGIVQLTYQNISKNFDIFIISLPSSILMQGNQNVSI